MKKFLFSMVVFMSITAYAQQNLVGFTGGVTLANYRSKSGEYASSSKTKAGFTIGAIANIPTGKSFIIQPGINFTQKGSKEKYNFFGTPSKHSTTTNHIEVPVNFLYSNSGFFIGAGPSFSFTVSGKWRSEFGTDKTEGHIKIGNGENDEMKSFDIGGNVLGGYQFKNGILISVNYCHGLMNLLAGSSPDNMTYTNRYFGIRLGYMLQTGKKK